MIVVSFEILLPVNPTVLTLSSFFVLLLSPLSLCLMRPWRMRMKWRLFSVSLSVSMAMPPMPEFSSSDVSVELNVSVDKTRYHIEYLHSLTSTKQILLCKQSSLFVIHAM